MFWSSILNSLLLIIGISIIVGFLIKSRNRQLIVDLTKPGYYSLLFAIYFPLVTSASWVTGVAIRKGGDINIDSRMVGIGGAEYGLNTDLFLTTAAIKSLIAFITCIMCLTFKSSEKSVNNSEHRRTAKNWIEFSYKKALGISVAFGAILLVNFTLYFTSVGWFNLFSVDLNRWELVSDYYDSTVSRISLAMTLPLGLGILVGLKRNWFFYILFIVNLMPAISNGSRIYSVLLCFLLVKLFSDNKSKWFSILLSPVYGLVVIYVFVLPLIQRNEDFGGVYSIVRSFNKLLDREIIDIIALMLVNVGQGFGVTVEVVSSIDNGTKEFIAPFEYHILQFSPFPSLIDGYDRNWVQQNPRINVFTPIGFLGHNILISYAMILVQPVVVYLFFAVCRLIANQFSKSYVMAVAAASIAPFSAIAEQYPPRNALRVLEAGLIVIIIGIAVSFFLGERSRQIIKPQ